MFFVFVEYSKHTSRIYKMLYTIQYETAVRQWFLQKPVVLVFFFCLCQQDHVVGCKEAEGTFLVQTKFSFFKQVFQDRQFNSQCQSREERERIRNWFVGYLYRRNGFNISFQTHILSLINVTRKPKKKERIQKI